MLPAKIVGASVLRTPKPVVPYGAKVAPITGCSHARRVANRVWKRRMNPVVDASSGVETKFAVLSPGCS
jgi:hypothetical protein